MRNAGDEAMAVMKVYDQNNQEAGEVTLAPEAPVLMLPRPVLLCRVAAESPLSRRALATLARDPIVPPSCVVVRLFLVPSRVITALR